MSLYPRERLSEALRESANRGIALVIAPAGFGKSEAVDDAFGEASHWVALPESPSIEKIVRSVVESAAPHALRALTSLLSNTVTDEHRTHLIGWLSSRLRSVENVIVLDDFHRVCADREALAFIREVIASTVPSIRWVLISRETPELPLGTWLARDLMTLPLSADDLAFDVDEAASLAAAMDVRIDAAALDTLVTDVAGWPLAIRLSLSAWDRTQALPSTRIRTRSLLFDFLDSEIWLNLSDDERSFFEAAALLPDLRPRLLSAAGFPESRLSLEHMHRRLPLLAKLGNGAYRLHELLRDFILERPHLDVAARAALTKNLTRALERFGTLEDAIALAMRTGDYDAALALLARRGVEHIENGGRAEIVAALKRFPTALQNDAVVTGLRGYAIAIEGNFELARREMERALTRPLDDGLRGALELQCGNMEFNLRRYPAAIERLGATMRDSRLSSETRMKAAAGLALVCAMSGDAQAARDAMGFCASGLEAGSVELRAFVRHRLAYAYFSLGEYNLAEHYANDCVQLAESAGLDGAACRGYAILQSAATVLYADGLLTRRYAELCLRSAEAAGDRSMQSFATDVLVSLACMQGDDDLWNRLSENRDPRMQDTRNSVWMRVHSALREAGRGQLGRAIAEVNRIERAGQPSTAGALADSVLALLYATHDREKADPLLQRAVLATAEASDEAMRYLIYAQAFNALAHWSIGQSRSARRARMPNPGDLPPADAALIGVISTICSTSRQTVTGRQLDQLTEPLVALGFGGYARFLRSVLAPAAVHQLTRTELDVLRALRNGGTTLEVAERLGKSSHTVLSHIKSACTKIGCSGRLAAVNYAVEQGWIS